MRVGVVVPMSASDAPPMPSWRDVLAFAQHAERLGLDSLWVCDHLMSDPGDGHIEGIHEAWTILSALAASTRAVELGQLVMCSPFRAPTLLAKMAATADAVSGGRLVLGIGAGWYEAEHDAFGFPTDHRVPRLDEAVQIVTALLDGKTVTFEGRFHVARGAALLPRPDRRVPVLVAGTGPRILRIAARNADAWNTAWYGAPDDRLRERLAALDAALDAEGRDRETIRRTVGVWVEDPARVPERGDPHAFRGSVEELAGVLQSYEALGVDDVIVGLTPMSPEALDRIAAAREASLRL